MQGVFNIERNVDKQLGFISLKLPLVNEERRHDLQNLLEVALSELVSTSLDHPFEFRECISPHTEVLARFEQAQIYVKLSKQR